MGDKVPLTPELWDAIWKGQNDREAQRRERLRQAVAKSPVPLSDALVQALILLPDEHLREILREHPGFELEERRASYLAALSVAEVSLRDLLDAIASFEREATSDGSALFYGVNGDALEAIEQRIQKELFATANAAASLVDHSRRVQKVTHFDGYEDQLHAAFGSDGSHDFVIGLRVLLHHLHIVKAGWSVQTSFSEGTRTATFTIHKRTLLWAIAQHPERFGGKKGEALQAYVDAAASDIDLRVVFEEYSTRLQRFHAWMREQLASESLAALHDYDRCMKEKKNFGTRTSWNLLLGTWLRNMKVPPNPHDHLHKYLTPEQLEEVDKLPRNSKAQVDLVISYVDTEHAINDKLRAMAYELFERSPAPHEPSGE